MKRLLVKLAAIATTIVAAAIWITGLLRIRREVETIANEAKKEKKRIKDYTDKELQDNIERKVR